jgi:hypothetical protein
MANACVLWRREQLIAHGSALTATSQLSRVFLDGAHVVFPMLTWIRVRSFGEPLVGGAVALVGFRVIAGIKADRADAINSLSSMGSNYRLRYISASRIGWLGTVNIPANGLSMSRITNIAEAMDMAPAASAV